MSKSNQKKRDRETLGKLTQDPRLTWDERQCIKDTIAQLIKLERDKSWRNPYAEAISLLESAARSNEGSYG